MKVAIFPGQGSQTPGMGAALFDKPPLGPLLEELNDASSLNLKSLCLDSDEETLRQTQNAQLALFAVGVLAYHSEEGGYGAFAGHSIGEYAALAASGAVSVADGVRLVKRRGELMATAGSARPGGMAAILGLERGPLEALCAGVGSGVVVIANDNCPGQLVISGDKAAVLEACELAKGAGAKRALPLNVSGAFHSPLMVESAKLMGEALRGVTFQQGTGPVYSNVLAAPVTDAAQWPDLLERQLMSPVRWTESVQRMVSDGAAGFVEYGVGQVLCGLVKRIEPGVATRAVG